jgi:hypothetical protein
MHTTTLSTRTNLSVLPLHTEDGVFMPHCRHSIIGKNPIKAAYDKESNELKFNAKLNIAE